MAELGLADTNGILRQPWMRPERTSAGLGWQHLYVSSQAEIPYRASFEAARTHLLILHRDGPVTVRRGHQRLSRTRHIPPGGMFLHPAGRDLTVELGGDLHTVHVYLDDAALQEASGREASVRLSEELGSSDPLLEQLVLTLDRVVRGWEPAGRTYVDHLTGLLAARLARRHCVRATCAYDGTVCELPGRQLAAVQEVMEARLAEPLPLADLAAAVSLSVSQFARRFKAATGEPPHRYLLRLRLEKACRMLRAEGIPIAEVAARCGFSHQEHLTRVMRTRLGTTPATVRREG